MEPRLASHPATKTTFLLGARTQPFRGGCLLTYCWNPVTREVTKRRKGSNPGYLAACCRTQGATEQLPAISQYQPTIRSRGKRVIQGRWAAYTLQALRLWSRAGSSLVCASRREMRRTGTTCDHSNTIR